MPPLLFFFIAALVLSGVALIALGLFDRQQEAAEYNMAQRLERVSTVRHQKVALEDLEADRDFARFEENRMKKSQRRTTYLPTVSEYAAKNNWVMRLEEELIQVRSQWRATELLAGSIFLAVLVLTITVVSGLGFWSFLIAAPFLLLPRLYVRIKRAAYYRKFDDQLADALMLMSNSLRAGFSFLQAMEMVAREAPSPIGDEFARVTQEIGLGVPIGEALNALSARIKSMDLALVVTAVVIQREVGGALAQLLELIAAVIRERQTIKGEIRTLTSQGRLTGYILGMMPISVGLAIFLVGRAVAPNDPSFIDPLIHTQLGNLLLIGAFLWQMIGFWLIMRIVSIKV